jgi:hypothetical protein
MPSLVSFARRKEKKDEMQWRTTQREKRNGQPTRTAASFFLPMEPDSPRSCSDQRSDEGEKKLEKNKIKIKGHPRENQ